jgi:ATPase subunit of ABC transporter with duplicated ATPase domains
MQIPQINLHNLSYIHHDETPVFQGLSLSFVQQKIGLVGKNGAGKSTLLRLLAGEIMPTSGSLECRANIYYCPQRIVKSDQTIAERLGVADRLAAIERISQGSVDVNDFELVGDDWACLGSVEKILADFGLTYIELSRKLSSLSGGERTRVSLAAAFYSHADFLLLDEPTNNLDSTVRQLLYQKVKAWKGGLVVASHDRDLLNLVDQVVELNSLGASVYGGNYNFYEAQKYIKQSAVEHELEVAKSKLKKAKQSIQKSKEHHEQNQKKGRKVRRSQSQAKVILDGKCERSEQTQSTMLIREKRLLKQSSDRLAEAREKIEVSHDITIELPETAVASNKIVLEVEKLSFAYVGQKKRLFHDVSFQIRGPERMALTGKNGAGKTTLIKLLLGELLPANGLIKCGVEHVFYVDQRVSGLDDALPVLENFRQYNPSYDDTHARRCLAQFLFRGDDVLKPVNVLSGGERLRALLACIFMSIHPPQLLILDEPTNHLDIQSLQSLESALQCYKGAMLVVSHDKQFLRNIGVNTDINLNDS